MKKILIVTYYFPPDAAVGALRSLKFSKYLPEFGWQPYVLTVKEAYCDTLDPSRMRDVVAPQQVFRTGVWPDPGVLYLKLKKWLYRLSGRRDISDETLQAESNASPPGATGTIGQLRHRMLSFLAVAGGKLGWVPPATAKAFLLVKRHDIDCLYTTGPPHAAHLVGLAMKVLTGRKWVADFRDPWTLVPAGTPRSPFVHAAKIEAWLERQVIERADKVICVTDRMSLAFRTKYSHVDQGKFVTIPNGYDPDDFSGLSRPARNGIFKMSYLGTFYMRRTPEYFLKAVRELIDESKLSQEGLEIRFIGDCRHIDGKPVATMVQQAGLSSITKIMDSVPYREALQVMVDSRLLLLFAPAQDDQVPGKTFEYLASGADVIAVTSSEGATASVIRATGRGFVVEPGSIQQMKDALESSYRQYALGTCDQETRSKSDDALLMYHRKTLTSKLVSILE
jgi:glycosyltransferase involved in cell wall biosynthesis